LDPNQKRQKPPKPEEYYKWVMRLSLPNMHRPDFVLIVHNMFERHKAVSTSYLRAKAQIGENTNADLFAEMSCEDL
jgi:hypothetical protein